MAVKFQVAGGSTSTQFQAQHIIALDLSAFSVGPTAADNTFNVDTVNGIVSNDSDSAAAVIRVVGENLAASTGAFEVGAGNVQGAGLTATWGGAAITKVELLTNGAWPLNLGYNNLSVISIIGSGATGISIAGLAAGSGVTIAVTSSGATEGLNLQPKGSPASVVIGTAVDVRTQVIVQNSTNQLYFGVESTAGGGIATGALASAGIVSSNSNFALQFATNSIVRATLTATGLSLTGTISTASTVFLHVTTGTLADGAAAQAGTLLNSPIAGNPTKWVAINDNGTTRLIPTW